MNIINVIEILPYFIYGCGGHDNKRYAEILAEDNKHPEPGTIAEFRDPQGRVLIGKVMPWRMQGENVPFDVPGSQVIDTKFTSS